MKTKHKEKSYLNKLYKNFAENFDIYFLYFIIAGLILELVRLNIIGSMGYFPLVPLIIYIYILLKIFWFDIPIKRKNENKKT